MPDTLKPDELVSALREYQPWNVVRWPGDDGEERIPNIAWACALIEAAADRLSALQSDLEQVTAERDTLDQECSLSMQTIAEERSRAESAEAALVKARAALEPFANVAAHDIGEDEADTDTSRPMTNYNRVAKITVGDMRRARLALSDGEEDNGR